MKNTKLIFILLALFTMALSSCSRGYGCYYTATEMKEIKTTVELQKSDVPEVEDNTILSTELIVIAD